MPQFLSLELNKPLFVRQHGSLQEFRIFLPDYKPYVIYLRGSTFGTLFSKCLSATLTCADARNKFYKHNTFYGISQRVQNAHWVANMMWTPKPVVHLCPTDGLDTNTPDDDFQPGFFCTGRISQQHRNLVHPSWLLGKHRLRI